MDNKKILIIGGLGFIGSNLAARLVELNANVTLLDNLFNNSVDLVAGCRLVIGEALNLDILLDYEEFDYIFHFGEYSRVEKSFEDEQLVFENNRNSFYSILRYSQSKCAK